MKKWKHILVITLLFCLMIPTVSVAAATDNETVVSFDLDGEQLELKHPESSACFWEFPSLEAGQHRADGLLRLHNDSKKDASVTLKDFKLPTDKPEEMEYLKALNLTVSVMKNGAKEAVYTGPYADIGDLQVTVDVPKNMEGSIFFEMSCDFAYEGECKLTDTIPYIIDAKTSIEGAASSSAVFKIILVIVIVVVVTAVTLLVIFLIKKKSKKSA